MSVELLLAGVGADLSCLPARFRHCLTPAEQARAARFRRPEDRVQFTAARGLLHEGLRRCFGLSASIGLTGANKPALVGEGLPPGLDFNLSHADGLVACAIGLGAAVGVDVERSDRVVDAAGIAAGYFAESERAAIAAGGNFLTLWTLKEAVAKAVGLGLALPLKHVVCELDPPRLTQAPAALGPLAEWRLQAWREPSHHVALAVRGPCGGAARVHRIDPASLSDS